MNKKHTDYTNLKHEFIELTEYRYESKNQN
jgi:hypothetical protein